MYLNILIFNLISFFLFFLSFFLSFPSPYFSFSLPQIRGEFLTVTFCVVNSRMDSIQVCRAISVTKTESDKENFIRGWSKLFKGCSAVEWKSELQIYLKIVIFTSLKPYRLLKSDAMIHFSKFKTENNTFHSKKLMKYWYKLCYQNVISFFKAFLFFMYTY